MNPPLVGEGSFALVTGASSGIGEAFARELARRRVPLLLVARSREKLERLSAELARLQGVRAEAMPADLARPGAAAALFGETEEAGRPVDLLINAAGFGYNGPQADLEPERLLELLQVDVMATAEMTHRFLGAMRERRRGAILNVGSTSGFIPLPFFAAYGASKAFVLHFTHALHEEARRDGVTVTCLCPGYTKTNFYAVAGMRGAEGTPFPEMSPQAVAEIGLRAVGRKRAVVVTHPLDRLWIFSARFAPRSLPPRLAGAFFSRTRLSRPG